jgi:hypothetical protein
MSPDRIRRDKQDGARRAQQARQRTHQNLNCARPVLAGALLASTRPSRWADAKASSHPVPAHLGVLRRVP